ncbi:MAG: HNH endonuclease signature motif containing protein [Brevibacterium linens]
MTPGQRYNARIEVDAETGCWNWTGSDKSKAGYCRFYVEGKRTLVHRWAYEYFKEPIPDGWTVHHKCVNPSCSNPEHLEALPQRQNLLESDTAQAAVRARATICINGHEFNDENTYVNPTTGFRKCRVCGKLRARKYNTQKRLERARLKAA